MNAKTAFIETVAALVPGLILSLLVLPLMPVSVRGAILEGDGTGALVLFGLIVMTLIFILAALSRLAGKLLVSCGVLTGMNLDGRPAWLADSVLRRVREIMGVDIGVRGRDSDLPDLAGRESECLFALIRTYVSEHARSSYSEKLSALSLMFRNLFTAFATLALIYPFIQPYPLTERLSFSLGQRLSLTVIFVALALIALFQSRFYRNALRQDVINRFIAISHGHGK